MRLLDATPEATTFDLSVCDGARAVGLAATASGGLIVAVACTAGGRLVELDVVGCRISLRAEPIEAAPVAVASSGERVWILSDDGSLHVVTSAGETGVDVPAGVGALVGVAPADDGAFVLGESGVLWVPLEGAVALVTQEEPTDGLVVIDAAGSASPADDDAIAAILLETTSGAGRLRLVRPKTPDVDVTLTGCVSPTGLAVGERDGTPWLLATCKDALVWLSATELALVEQAAPGVRGRPVISGGVAFVRDGDGLIASTPDAGPWSLALATAVDGDGAMAIRPDGRLALLDTVTTARLIAPYRRGSVCGPDSAAASPGRLP